MLALQAAIADQNTMCSTEDVTDNDDERERDDKT